jgi:hypothetical protein
LKQNESTVIGHLKAPVVVVNDVLSFVSQDLACEADSLSAGGGEVRQICAQRIEAALAVVDVEVEARQSGIRFVAGGGGASNPPSRLPNVRDRDCLPADTTRPCVP